MPKSTSKIKRYIITGTPGSGKTSIIHELARRGCDVVQEAATDVITRNQQQGIEKPWLSVNFIDDIVDLQKQRQLSANGKRQFYDRSPICTYALAQYLGYEPSKKLMHVIHSMIEDKIYQNKIFFIDHLGYIKNTDARQISFDEALKFEALHLEAYHEFGFETVHISKKPVADRVDEILHILN